MEKYEMSDHSILSEVALVTQVEPFLRRWELGIKEKQLWPFPISFSCCSLEFQSLDGVHHGSSEFDLKSLCNNPKDADLLVIGGTVTQKMVPYLKEIYESMPEEKWVLAVGACASSGGPYWSQSVVQGISQIFPVDVYLPGCPPAPSSIIQAFSLIRERVKKRVTAESQARWSLDV